MQATQKWRHHNFRIKQKTSVFYAAYQYNLSTCIKLYTLHPLLCFEHWLHDPRVTIVFTYFHVDALAVFNENDNIFCPELAGQLRINQQPDKDFQLTLHWTHSLLTKFHYWTNRRDSGVLPWEPTQTVPAEDSNRLAIIKIHIGV